MFKYLVVQLKNPAGDPALDEDHEGGYKEALLCNKD